MAALIASGSSESAADGTPSQPAGKPGPSSAATQALILLVAIASSLLVYFPYRHDMKRVYAFWDGPSYLLIAHDFYEVHPGNPFASDPSKPPFYASHLPGYPMTVRALAFVGYEHALLLATVLAACVAAMFFYRLARDVWKLESPGFLTIVFLFLPPRWVLYRSIGASEPLFLAGVLASLYFFEKRRVGLSAVAAAVVCATRFNGLLMIPSYAFLLWKRGAPRRTWLWLAVIPIVPVLYALFFINRFGSVFPAVDRNLELIATPIPFWDLTRALHSWPGTHAELYMILSALYAFGMLRTRKFASVFAYTILQFAFIIVVSGGDWPRYYLAIAPLALVLGYEDLICSRPFRWIFPLFAVGSIYWAQRIIPFNVCKIYADVAAYLQFP